MYFFNPDCNYIVTSVLKEKLLMLKDLTSFLVLLIMLVRFLATTFSFSLFQDYVQNVPIN